jgi:ubiquinol-cytochrome c reductase cytochrome b subunit
LTLSRLGAAYYFLHFLVILPFLTRVERPSPLPVSLSTVAIKTTDVR